MLALDSRAANEATLKALTAKAASPSSTTSSSSTAQGGTDYSRFTHTNPQHARLPRLLCHRREDNSPRPVRSQGHTPCSGCHAQQFADASSHLCTDCHADKVWTRSSR